MASPSEAVSLSRDSLTRVCILRWCMRDVSRSHVLSYTTPSILEVLFEIIRRQTNRYNRTPRNTNPTSPLRPLDHAREDDPGDRSSARQYSHACDHTRSALP